MQQRHCVCMKYPQEIPQGLCIDRTYSRASPYTHHLDTAQRYRKARNHCSRYVEQFSPPHLLRHNFSKAAPFVLIFSDHSDTAHRSYQPCYLSPQDQAKALYTPLSACQLLFLCHMQNERCSRLSYQPL